MTLEIRAPDDVMREEAGAALTQTAHEIAQRRGLGLGLGLDIARTYSQPATPCSPQIIEGLSKSVETGNREAPLHLASGATHDSSAMAALCPVGMLFTACRDGVSHHPDEHVPAAAMPSGILALERYLMQLQSSACHP